MARFRTLTVGTIVAVMLFASDISFSAEIWHGRPETKDADKIYLKGTITADDPARFRVVAAEMEKTVARSKDVRLSSDGGDVFAAIEIGRLIRAGSMSTTVHVDDRCVSACVFAYAGGVLRLAADGRLGIHRPYNTDTGLSSLGEADQRFKKLDALVHAYFKEMNVSDRLADEMLRIEPQDVKFLTYVDATRYGLWGRDPSYADLIASNLATKYGLSKQEYFKRNKRVELECDPQVFDFFACEGSIMWGIPKSEYWLRANRLRCTHLEEKAAVYACERAGFHRPLRAGVS